MTAAAKEFAREVGMAPLCRALDVSRSSAYRLIKKAGPSPVASSRPKPDRALTEDEKRTVLFVTHDVDEALILADRILVIYEGEIVGEFPPTASEEELGVAMTGGGRREAIA